MDLHSTRGKLQRELALLLHHEADVPFGPCGYDALTAFSAAPSLVNYQITLVDADHSFHITTFGHVQDKQLILLHEKGPYDVITRLPGFFGSSYVCAYCWKPYDHVGGHRCSKQKDHCRACCQKACPDFLHAYPGGLKATRRCQHCHRDIPGETCYEAHGVKGHTGKPATNPQNTVCSRRRRCPSCFKLEVGGQHIQRHQCGYLTCPSCHEYVNGQTHRCFIQRALTSQELREQKKKRKRRRPEVLPPNKGSPRVFKPCKPMKRRKRWTTTWRTCHPCTWFLTLRPCNPGTACSQSGRG